MNLNERIYNDKEKENVDKIFNILKKHISGDIRFNTNMKFNADKKINFYHSSFKFTDTFDNELTIIYITYVVDSLYQKDIQIANGIIETSCEADYDDKSIKLNLIYEKYNDFVNYDELYRDLFHEYHHIYQYTKGFTKDVSLYDKVVEGTNKRDNPLILYASYCLYYTFKHEEDAFMTQVYNAMIQNYRQYKDRDITIDEVSKLSPQYQNFMRMVLKFYDYYNEDVDTIKELTDFFGIPASTITAKIKTAENRFQKKFNNVIKKFEYYIKTKYTHNFMESTMLYTVKQLDEGYKPYDDISFLN